MSTSSMLEPRRAEARERARDRQADVSLVCAGDQRLAVPTAESRPRAAASPYSSKPPDHCRHRARYTRCTFRSHPDHRGQPPLVLVRRCRRRRSAPRPARRRCRSTARRGRRPRSRTPQRKKRPVLLRQARSAGSCRANRGAGFALQSAFEGFRAARCDHSAWHARRRGPGRARRRATRRPACGRAQHHHGGRAPNACGQSLRTEPSGPALGRARSKRSSTTAPIASGVQPAGSSVVGPLAQPSNTATRPPEAPNTRPVTCREAGEASQTTSGAMPSGARAASRREPAATAQMPVRLPSCG